MSLMSELRWTLLLLGIVFIVLLAVWERRRPRQANPHAGERTAAREGGADSPRVLREPSLTLPEMRAREPLVPRDLPVVEIPDPPTAPFRGVAGNGEQMAEIPAEFPEVSGEEFPEASPGEYAEQGLPEDTFAAEPPEPQPAAPTGIPALSREALPELPPSLPLVVEWPPDDSRRIVALRLVATNSERFAGRSLRQALAAEGFVLGQFAIFHKPDDARRAVLSAASLARPGTFDMDTMDSQHYGGLSLFAVLPGPKAPPLAFDELVVTARSLNDRLHGVLQDEQGSPLTPARIASLRERLAAAS